MDLSPRNKCEEVDLKLRSSIKMITDVVRVTDHNSGCGSHEGRSSERHDSGQSVKLGKNYLEFTVIKESQGEGESDDEIVIQKFDSLQV